MSRTENFVLDLENKVLEVEDVARNVEVLNVLDIEDKVKNLEDED